MTAPTRWPGGLGGLGGPHHLGGAYGWSGMRVGVSRWKFVGVGEVSRLGLRLVHTERIMKGSS